MAYRYVAYRPDAGVFLVHGLMPAWNDDTGQLLDDQLHAWVVESDGWVWEPTGAVWAHSEEAYAARLPHKPVGRWSALEAIRLYDSNQPIGRWDPDRRPYKQNLLQPPESDAAP
jgi:hypothetical protein